MELEIRLTELNTMKASYKNQKYEMEHNLAKVYPKRQANLKALQNRVERDHGLYLEEKNRMGDAFKLNVDGHDYFNIEEAGKAFQKAHYELLGVGQMERKIAEFCGLDIYVNYDFNTEKRKTTIRTNGSSYEYNFGRSADSAIKALETIDDFFVDQKKEIENEQNSIEKQIVNASQLLETPFEYDDEIREKTDRLEEVEVALSEENKDEIKGTNVSHDIDTEYER